MTRFAGVDPGLKHSHFVVIEATGETCVYGPKARLKAYGAWDTPVGNLGAWPGLLHPPLLRAGDVAGVEVARGSVASGRDADPVLQNNIVAGLLLGRLSHFGALPCASGGQAAHWNWRSTLGVTGKGASARDKSVARLVDALLIGPLPVGPRGGKSSHYYDAAGIALALMIRAASQPHLPPLDACREATPHEQLVLEHQASIKQARRVARALGRRPAHRRA